MKRWQVVARHYGPLAMALCWGESVVGEYRWLWLARFNAFMWNTAPMFSPSFATVRRKPPELRVVK